MIETMLNATIEQLNIYQCLGKPRTSGITMILNKHLGLAATRDLIETAGSYIDIVKLG